MASDVDLKEYIKEVLSHSPLSGCKCQTCDKPLTDIEHRIGFMATVMMCQMMKQVPPEDMIQTLLHCCFNCHAMMMETIGLKSPYADPTRRH